MQAKYTNVVKGTAADSRSSHSLMNAAEFSPGASASTCPSSLNTLRATRCSAAPATGVRRARNTADQNIDNKDHVIKFSHQVTKGSLGIFKPEPASAVDNRRTELAVSVSGLARTPPFFASCCAKSASRQTGIGWTASWTSPPWRRRINRTAPAARQNSHKSLRVNDLDDAVGVPATARESSGEGAPTECECSGKTAHAQRERRKTDVNKPSLQRLANHQRPLATKRSRRACVTGNTETDLVLPLVTSIVRGRFSEDVARTACNSSEVVDIKKAALRMTRVPTTLLLTGV